MDDGLRGFDGVISSQDFKFPNLRCRGAVCDQGAAPVQRLTRAAGNTAGVPGHSGRKVDREVPGFRQFRSGCGQYLRHEDIGMRAGAGLGTSVFVEDFEAGAEVRGEWKSAAAGAAESTSASRARSPIHPLPVLIVHPQA